MAKASCPDVDMLNLAAINAIGHHLGWTISMWERGLAALAAAIIVQVSLSPVMAQKRSAAPTFHRAPAAPVHVPSARPLPTISIPHQVRSTPAPRNISSTQVRPTSAPRSVSSTQVRPTLGPQNISARGPALVRPGVHVTPVHYEYARARAVHRQIARRIAITGGVLVLPVVVYYGVPVVLEVPEIGSVLVSEEDYASLYDQLSSTDPQQVELGVAALRAIKAKETAEGAQDGPINVVPANVESESSARDLSEPMSFSSPSKGSNSRKDSDARQRGLN